VDLAELLLAAATGALGDRPRLLPSRGSACCVALASAGYPGAVQAGEVVQGLDRAAARPGVKVFHAGTRRQGEEVLTAGGRVLYVVGQAGTLAEAVARAYGAIGPGGLSFAGMQHRGDIAARALA
jgi:phosphoribosylamine--glycine ligase